MGGHSFSCHVMHFIFLFLFCCIFFKLIIIVGILSIIFHFWLLSFLVWFCVESRNNIHNVKKKPNVAPYELTNQQWVDPRPTELLTHTSGPGFIHTLIEVLKRSIKMSPQLVSHSCRRSSWSHQKVGQAAVKCCQIRRLATLGIKTRIRKAGPLFQISWHVHKGRWSRWDCVSRKGFLLYLPGLNIW